MTQILQFAQKAIIEHKGKILVEKNSESASYNPGMIHLPGGRMEFGEGVDEHIIREVKEETNINIKPLEPIDVITWTVKLGADPRKSLEGKELQVVALIRHCKYISGKPTTEKNVDDEDIAELYWEDPKKLVNNPKFDNKMHNALKMYIKNYGA
jgi:ADP-ribose pyrophosphatase YjhB (NUDIX family)